MKGFAPAEYFAQCDGEGEGRRLGLTLDVFVAVVDGEGKGIAADEDPGCGALGDRVYGYVSMARGSRFCQSVAQADCGEFYQIKACGCTCKDEEEVDRGCLEMPRGLYPTNRWQMKSCCHRYRL